MKNLIYDFATKRDKIHGEVLFAGKDSIFISSDYRNNIALINHKGEILNTLCIDDILPDTIKKLNEYHLSYFPNSIDLYDNSIMFYVCCHDNIVKRKGLKPFTIEYYEEYFKNLYKTPYLLEVKNIFGSAEYKFLAQDYYKEINDKFFSIWLDGSFKILNKNIFIICDEKPLIFKYSGENYENLKIFEIKSKFMELTSNIAEVKIAWDLVKSPENREKYELTEKLRGHITSIFYNKQIKK